MKDGLAYGNAGSYNDYRHYVGRIEGMEYAKDVIKTILKQRLEEDED